MTRLPDWEERLGAYIASREAMPYEYGKHDCGLFAAGAVEAMTGAHPFPEFIGRYSTAAGSVRALKRYGAGTKEATFDAKFPTCPIGFARRGDLAFHEGSVGVVMGPFALFVGEMDGADGLFRVPRAEWERAWEIV